MPGPIRPALQRFENPLVVGIGFAPCQPKPDDAAGSGQLRPEGQLTEVLIVGGDDSLFRLSTGQDHVIPLGAHRLLDREHIMPRCRNP